MVGITLKSRSEAPGSSAELHLDLAGERIVLLAHRALWWEGSSTLFIADVHLGKPAAFRALGIPVPESATGSDLSRLGALIERTAAARLVLLGDLIHAKSGRQPETLDAFASWRRARPELAITLVRGNHDRSAGDPPADWGIDVVNGPVPMGPFVLAHEPAEDPRGHVLAGHIHPAARLHGTGGTSLRAPCFWVGPRVTVLPAFGSFTGAKAITPRSGDRVFVVGDGQVVEANLIGG
jgi:DNA ligase-associated metallophosphoesterase